MSNPPYNPYAPGNQNSNQGQYRLSNTQAQRDSQRAFLGPASSSSSSVASAVIPQNVGEYETSRAIRDEYTNTTGMHMLGATEGERPPRTPVHQPLDQGTTVTSTQRDEFCSPCIEMVSCPMTSASASLGHKHGVDFESDSSSLNWLSADGSILKSSSALSNYASIADGRSNNPDEEEHNMQTLPGLGDCDLLTSDKPAAAAEPRKPDAAEILRHFGLEEQDLEFLVACPEDQTTPDNLPLILHQIHQQKDKSKATQVESKPCLETQPAQIVSGVDSYSLSTSGGAVMHEKKVGLGHEAGMKSNRDNRRGSGTVFPMDDADNKNCQEPLQKKAPEMKSSEQASSLTSLGSSCSSTSPKKTTQSQMLPNQTFQNTLSSFSLSKKDTEMRAPKPVPLNQQEVDCQSTLKTKLPHCESQGLHPSRPGLVLIDISEPNQSFQDTFSPFPLPKKDTDVRVSKSEALKPVPLNQQEVDRQSTLKTKLPLSQSQGIHPSPPGIVLIGGNDTSDTNEESKSKGKRSVAVTSIVGQKGKKTKQMQHQSKQLIQKQPAEQTQEQPVQQQQPKKKTVQLQKLPVSEPGRAWTPGDFEKSVPLTGVIPGQTNVPTFKGVLKDKVAISIDQPTPETLYDYAVATPKIFPHTCSLCNKEYTDLKDWISHKFSIQHQTNSSKLLRKQPVISGAVDKPSTSTSANKTRRRSRSSSKSISPRRQSSPEGKRSRPRSRSQSPQRSRYSPSSPTRSSERQTRSPKRRSRSPKRRSRSPKRRSASPKRRSRSSERQSRSPRRRSRSPKRRSRSSERRSRSSERRSRSSERQSRSPRRRSRSPKRRSRSSERRSRSSERRSSKRKCDRLSPLRKYHDRRSPLRKRNETRLPSSKADDRRSPPWWNNKTRSPKRRSNERPSSPRRVANRKSSPRKKYSPFWRSYDRCSPSWRVGETLSPARKSDGSRSPRSQERRPHRERSSPQRKGFENLAKKVVETSAVKLLSDPTDLDSVVKSLAPALLAELAKMTQSTSPSRGGNPSSPSSCRKASCSPDLEVKPRRIPPGLSHAAAVDNFGKTKSVTVYRARQEAKQETSLEFKTTSPETQPDTGDSKHEPVPEKSDVISTKGSGVGLKDTDANGTVSEPERGPSITEKLPASQAKTQKPKSQDEDKLAESAADEGAPSRCVPSESQPAENTAESVKASPPTVVKLQGIDKSLSHRDVLTAAEHFGKTKSLVLIRVRSEAIVIFETGEDAKKLKMAESLDVNGRTISVIVEKETVSKEKTSPQKKQASKPEASIEEILPSSPAMPKGVPTEGGVLVSDATRVSAQQAVKTGTLSAKGDVKTEEEEQEISLRSKNQPDAGDSSQRPAHEMSKSVVKELVLGLTDEPIAPDPAARSKAESASTTQKPKTSSKAVRKETMNMTRTSEVKASENLPKTGAPKEKPTSENSATKGGGVKLVNTEVSDKSANRAARSMSKEEVDSASKGETGSTGKKAKPRVDKLAEPGAEEDASAPSRSADSQSQTHGQSVKVNQSEIKIHKSLEVPEDPTKTAEKEHVSVSKPEDPGKVVKKDDAREPVELEVSGGKDTEPVEVGICVEGKVEETTSSESAPDNPRDNQPPTGSVQNHPIETSVKASTQVKESPQSEPEFTTRGPKTRTEALQEEQQVVPSRSAHPQNQPQGVELGKNDINIQESLEVPKDTAKEAVKEAVIGLKHMGQERVDEAHDAEEPMDLGVSGAKVAEGKEGEITPEAAPVNSRPQTVETQPTETSIKASTQVQQSLSSEPESSAQGPETRTEQQQAVMPRGVATQQGVVKVSSKVTISPVNKEPTAAAKSVQKPAACKKPPIVPLVPVGELLHERLQPHHIRCLKPHFLTDSRRLPYGLKNVLVFGLPTYYGCAYSESEVSNLLFPFGFGMDSLYVVPQSRMAFVEMPSEGTLLYLMREAAYKGVFFRGQRLRFAVIAFGGPLKPLRFYKFLKKVLNCCRFDDAERTVFIRDISPRQIRQLREALKKFAPVTNFTPLLNKVFVEFQLVEDTERFGLWHSQQKQPLGQIVIRLSGQFIHRPVPAVATQSGAASASKTPVNVSAVEKVPTVQTPGISEQERLAAATVTKDRVAGKETAGPSKSEAPEKKPGAGVPKTKAIPDKPVTGVKGPQNQTAQIQKSENKSELAKIPLVDDNVLASKEGTVPTIQKAEKSEENQDETGAASHERTAKEPSENQTDAGESKHKPGPDRSDVSVKEPVVGLVETSIVDEPKNRTQSEVGEAPLVGQRVVAFKKESVSTTQKPETPSGKLALTEAIPNERTVQDVAEVLENPPGAGDPKLNPEPDKSVTNDKEVKVGLKENTNADMSENRTELAKGSLVEAKVLASIEEKVLTTKKPETPTEKLPAKETVTFEKISSDVTEASQTKPGLGDSEEDDHQSAQITNTAPVKGPLIGEKFVSKAETETTQKRQTPPETPPAAEDVTVPSTSEASENLPDTIDSKGKPEKSDGAIKGAEVELLKDTEEAKSPSSEEQVFAPKAETLSTKQEPKTQVETFKVKQDKVEIHKSLDLPKEKENLPVFERMGQEQTDEAHDAEEPMELEVSGAKAGENRGEETSSEFSPVKSTDKPKDSRPQTVESQQTEMSVEALTQVRESPLSEPESSARGPETRTEAPQDPQQQAAGRTQEAAVETVMPGAETKTSQHDVLTKETTQKDSTSTKEILCEPTAAASVTQPTVGEMLDKYLFPDRIRCVSTAKLLPSRTLLAISGLPTHDERSYTEDDVADLLAPYYFHDKVNNLYVIPQAGMAFATMPNTENVINIMRDYAKKGISFRGKGLHVQVVHKRCPFDQFEFYSLLKKIMKCSAADDDEERIVFIRNISPSEIRELRKTLKEFGPVTNFMPLLNKLFIELPSTRETERFAEWYGLLNHGAGHKVFWTKRRGYQRHSGPATTLTTQTDAASDQNSSVTPEKTRVKRPTEEDLANRARLTFGERFEKQLTRSLIASLMRHPGTSPKMLISWRNDDDVSYAEDDFIRLLAPFGYQHRDHNIYVAPQACLAFVLMPTARSVLDVIRASKGVPIILKGCELFFYALNNNISMNPTWFYKSLMELLKYHVDEHSNRLILIKDISPSDTRELREVLTKGRSVRNFLPLLNKVFVEFHTPSDADQLGVWYSLLKTPPAYRIQRLKIPYSRNTAKSPIAPMSSLLGSEDLIDGVTVPSAEVSVPQFSIPPFWITLRKGPFVFPTVSPWFVIPDHVTVWRKDDIMKAGRQGSMCPTIMLTGLPEGNYRHEDVARLVWPYFPKQTLHSLYYNVTVLPLQRRAFVFFSDWTTCCDFVQAHVARRVSLKGRVLCVHFVLQNMYPESSEETMYRSLMKWSNAGVPDPTSLEERLLCVEVSEVSLDVITLVVEMVASITSFANFMPLANRICIEMTDSSCVTKVVERYNEFSPSSFTEDPAWRKVKHFEHLETFKRRLQDSAEVTINLDGPDAIVGKDESPEMDEDMLKAITVTVGESRLVQRSGSQRVEKKTQDDFADGRVSSGAVLPHKEQLNEDFVTVEEVSDDVKDSRVEPRCPSSPERSSSPSRQQTSTRSTTSSSRATEDERSSSSRPEDSSEPIKSSSQSPPASSETPSSLDQNHPNGSSAPRLTGSKGGRVVVTIEAHPVGDSEMDTEGPLQERETVTKDGAATSQEDSDLVQRDGSTLKQLSEEGSGLTSGQSEDNPADEDDAGKKGETRDDSKQINASSKSTSEVISSVEDRPTDSETENKQPTSKSGEDVARGSDPTKEEEVSPRIPNRTKRYETRQRTRATAGKELMESSGERSGRRRSGRGKREDEVKERVITTRSTRGKTARNPEEASTEKTKGKDTPTRGSVKKRGVSQEDQSEDGKGCVRKQIQIGDDAGRESNEEPTGTTSRSEKRKLDNDADEVKEEESRTTPRSRGRPKKRARLTPVRKSSRRKEEPSSLEASSSPSADKDSSDWTPRTASAPAEGCLEERAGRSRVEVKVVSKKRSGAVGPEAKRSRSQSPSVPADFKRPEFKPDKPLSEEFVVPAFFCSLCSLFYQQESTSEEPHCSSQTHLHNLQKHYEELQQKSAGSSSKS